MSESIKILKKILIDQGYPAADLTLIKRAYAFANCAHRGQKRITGDDYISHPLAVAVKLARMRLGATVIAAALLHDVLEDTELPQEKVHQQLLREFGADIASLVERVTKLGKVQYHGIDRYIENLRKMFLAMAEDVRAVFIKFADRIHNLETLKVVPAEKRRRIALESLEVYAPIANRLGMGEFRGELEDLSFKYVYPDEYQWVSSLLDEKLKRRQEYLDKIQKKLSRDTKKSGIPCLEIHGRVKHLYSLYRKLLTRNRDINQIYDLVAVRVIVPTISDCYATLGVIHSKWKPLKGRIKDYISQPKPNGYQSLHTTVFCEEGRIIEIQIRTPAMHRLAEYGVAAHWQYSELGKNSRQPHFSELNWIKDFAKVQKKIKGHKQFLEHLEALKIDVFQNRIFLFTPQGDVLDLPEDATPIDFAYAIHTEIGNKCIGAKVNDEMVPLSTILKSGDVVEIIVDRNRKGPSPDWLKYAKTRHARDTIRLHAKHRISGWIGSVVGAHIPKQQTKHRHKKNK